jgi:hypothetical protein
MALVLDATALGERFVVLTVSVVYRGCAIPVAWTIWVGQQKAAWRHHWLRMLRQPHVAIPPGLAHQPRSLPAQPLSMACRLCASPYFSCSLNFIRCASPFG